MPPCPLTALPFRGGGVVLLGSQAGTTSDPALQVSDEERGEIRSFLAAAWPRLEVWFSWFNTTQAGPLPHSYR